MLSKKGILIICIELILVYLLIMGGVFGFDYLKEYLNKSAARDVTLSVLANSPINNQKLVDNVGLYNEADNMKIENLYITAYTGENPKAGSPFTLADLYSTSGRLETDNEPIIKVTVSQGLPEGIEGKLGFKATAPNGLMQIRGHSARNDVQKSLKIKLFGGTGSFYGQTILNLNKCPYDETRILQKTCCDMFTKLKDFVTLRTKFVHVFILDKSTSGTSATYKDYGLFTHIENPDKDFLAAHNLDENGYLYKASNFEFYRYPDEIKNVDDPSYNKAAFDSRLKQLSGKDNRKLIQMLDDINNSSIDINESFDKYFDKDNFLTWMAVNMLTANYDTTTQNYMLYSPLNSQKWYLLPWDLDGTMKNTTLIDNYFSQMPESQKGLSRYWSVNLQRRYFSYKDNVDALTKKVEEVRKIFLDNDFSGLGLKYFNLVDGIKKSSGDINHITTQGIANAPLFVKDFNNIIEKNYQIYLKSIHTPMPNFLVENKKVNGKWYFKWTPSQDIDGKMVYYDFQLASDVLFEHIIDEKKHLFSTDYTSDKQLAKGTYYYRAITYDSTGNIQYAFDSIDITTSHREFGVKQFTVD